MGERRADNQLFFEEQHGDLAEDAPRELMLAISSTKCDPRSAVDQAEMNR